MTRTLRSCWGVMGIVALLLLSGYGTAEALLAHPDACNACHKAPSTQGPRAIGNLCLNCHVSGGIAEAQGSFSGQAASNAFLHNPTVVPDPDPLVMQGWETSHFWGGSKSAYPQAGSKNPGTLLYASRYNISTGLVTCSVCHDPHADMGTTTKLLRTTTATSDLDTAICVKCHAPFNVNNTAALLTHPVGDAYATIQAAQPAKYKVVTVDANGKLSTNVNNGGIRLVNGNIACTSCHGTHFTDSNSSTVDASYSSLAQGDGKLLRTDGPSIDKSVICQTCHTYKIHGSTTGESVGCLVCHSAHVFNPSGAPNYYVLRNSATTTKYGDVTGISYTAIAPADLFDLPIWADLSPLTDNGFCEKCHGNLTTMAGSTRQHNVGENCRPCHAHSAVGQLRSFEALNCEACHAYPPALNSPKTGYAVNGAKNYSTDANFKNEALTPHSNHSGPTNSYNFSCTLCHNADFSTTHDKGSFQDVFTGAGFQSAVKPVASEPNPSYIKTGNGTCYSVACHSNGGKRTGDGIRNFNYTNPAWAGGRDSITTCSVCHGNTAVTMGAAQRANSTSHIKHLNQGYSCEHCHADTAISAVALKPGSEKVKHVNGSADVKFSGQAAGGTYTAVTGTCSVMCHGANTPDWDIAATGACGTCHQYSLAGVTTGSGVALGDAHAKHIYAVSGGVVLACTICHSNNGSGVDHANGTPSLVVNYQTTVCNVCHGASNGITTGDDRQPIWSNTATVNCQTCHAGSVMATVNSKVAADKSIATSTGHNKTSGNYGVSGNVAANKSCINCHDGAAAGHFDGVTGDDKRLLSSAATCTTSCHGVGGSAVKDGIVTHQTQACADCHDPHGTSNIYMVAATSSSYSGTVVFTAVSGSNSYDEIDAINTDDLCATCHTYNAGVTTTHNNKTHEGVAHNEGADCFTCHKSHTDAEPFAMGAGTACNDCHGFPPATGAHRTGALLADDELHSKTTLTTTLEDRTDCAVCHTGANLYTYDLAADIAAGRNHSNATGRRTILATSVGYNSTDKNCTSACHASTVSNGGAWNTTSGLSCNACHYYESNPTSANNIAAGAGNTLTGNHSKHFGTGSIATCSSCHVVDNGGLPLSGPLLHITTASSGSDLLKIQGRAAAVQDEAAVTAAALGAGGSNPIGNATCNNTLCHNPSNTTYTAVWQTSLSSCALCHSATDPTTGSHSKHMGAAITFGINTTVCTSCHADNGTNYAHRTGSVNLLAGMAYTAGALDVGGTVGTCTTTACHNNGLATPAAVITPIWGADSDDCTICHGNGPTTGKHAKHIANVTYVAAACTACHPAATATSHINGSRNLGGQITDMDLVTVGLQLTAPGGWNGTCANTCHIADTASDWTGATTLACADCHGSTLSVDKGWPPSSGSHTAHVGNTAYITAVNCTDCHNNNATTHSALNGVAVVSGKISSYVSAAGTCTNSCHGGTADFRDNTPTVACVDCHSGTYIGGNNAIKGFNATPTSGLHNVTPSVTGQRHNQTLPGGCAACHNTLLVKTTHINGALTGDTMANLGLQFYTQTAANVGSCVNTSCHFNSGSGSSDDWAHKWMAPANYNVASAACVGCHNDWTNTTSVGPWNAGVIHKVAGDTRGQHGANAGTYKCKDCHNLSSDTGANTGYTFVFGSNDWGGTSTHGDGIIQLNNNGSTFNPVTGLCAPCHSVIDEHSFVDTGWAIANALGTPITVTCGACHNGAGVSDISFTSSGAHTTHNAGLGALIDGGADCVPCHGNNGGQGFHNTQVGTIYPHGNGTVEFIGVTYSTATRNDLTGTCSTASCHNKGVEPSAAWNAVQLDCEDCHFYATGSTPTAAANSAHAAPLQGDHGVHFGTGGTALSTCLTCHANAPLNGSGDMTHVNGTTSLVDKCNALADEAEVTVDTWDGLVNTCGNIECHNPSFTTYKATWNVDTANCGLCHANNLPGADPGTGSHTNHMTRTATFGRAIICSDCHVVSASNRHFDGALTVQIRNTAGVFGTVASPVLAGGCGTNECHNSGTGAAPKEATYQWGISVLTDCLECHENNATMATNSHDAHWNNGYAGAACTDCHMAATNSLHMNRTINFDAAKTTYSHSASVAIGGTANGTCLTSGCHNPSVASTAWNTTGDLACNSCHGDGTAGLSASHANHISAGKTCAQCHDTLPTTTAHINNRSSLSDGATAVAGEANVTFVHASAVTDYTYNSTDQTCGSATNNGLGCHATGTPDWGVAFASSACTNCHTNTTTAAVNPTSGLHNVVPGVTGVQHDNNFGTGGTCSSCHNTVPNFGTHKDGDFTGDTVANLGLRYYTQTAANTGTCATTTCHLGVSDDWAHKWMAPANYSSPTVSCAGCHGDWTNTWNSGTIHRTSATTLAMHGGTATYKCDDCHAIGSANYPFTFGTADWAPLNAGNNHGNAVIEINNNGVTYNTTSGLCTNCHSTSDNIHNFLDTSWSNGSVAGDPIAISCGGCHSLGVTRTGQSGAHAAHNASSADVLADSGTDCIPCHGNNGGSGYGIYTGTHNDGLLTLVGPTYSKTAGDLTGTCSNASCHYSQTTPAWNTTNSTTCTTCHNDGSVAVPGAILEAWPSKNKNGTASSDIHGAHVTNTAYVTGANCTDCHGDNSVTHSNAFDGTVVTTGTKVSAYTTLSGTCTNSCHVGVTADFRDNLPTLVCDDCHNASGKTLYVSGALTATTPPATGKHAIHDASTLTQMASGCATCHPHNGTLGSPATTKHVNGAAVSNTNVDGTRITDVDLVTAGVQTQTAGGWAGTCTNICHSASVADDSWTTGVLECDDCHVSTYLGGIYSTNGKHDKHNLTTQNSYASPAQMNNSSAATYDFHCKNCHAGTHMNNVKEMTLGNWNNTLKTCGLNSCHQDGKGAAPVQTVGWTGTPGYTGSDVCKICHGNSPTTGSHIKHAVGIHYTKIFTGTTGFATAGNLVTSSHGNSTNATTISCNTCHNNTVNEEANVGNAVCAGCHTDSNTPLTGNEMAIISDKSLHVNGTKDVGFINVPFRSKAQVRSDITTIPSLNAVWTRVGTYKASGSYDQSKSNLSSGTFTAGNSSCSNIACHNNRIATWGGVAGCISCHDALP